MPEKPGDNRRDFLKKTGAVSLAAGMNPISLASPTSINALTAGMTEAEFLVVAQLRLQCQEFLGTSASFWQEIFQIWQKVPGRRSILNNFLHTHSALPTGKVISKVDWQNTIRQAVPADNTVLQAVADKTETIQFLLERSTMHQPFCMFDKDLTGDDWNAHLEAKNDEGL